MTLWKCPKGPEILEVPIGRPMPGCNVYVRDPDGNLCPLASCPLEETSLKCHERAWRAPLEGLSLLADT